MTFVKLGTTDNQLLGAQTGHIIESTYYKTTYTIEDTHFLYANNKIMQFSRWGRQSKHDFSYYDYDT